MSCRTLQEIAEDIADVRKAIKAARSGQSYSFGGRSVTRADYRALREELADLIAEQSATESAQRGMVGIRGIPSARRY